MSLFFIASTGWGSAPILSLKVRGSTCLAPRADLYFVFSPNSVDTLGVLVKHRCLIGCACAGVCGYSAAIYTTFTPLQNSRSAFRLRRLANSAWPRRALVATALSLWFRAHFRTWWSLFLAGARETSRLGPKSTFRDKCKGSEEMQISWQVQLWTP